MAPPATTGYGTQLIQSATTHSLGGQVEQKFAAGGLETEIVIPLESASPGLKAVHAEDRVIVEDEFLIALDLQLVLEHHGWRVMKPVATVRDAC